MSEKNAMDNQPIRDERILHAIEACRPDSDDLADPALKFLAEELAADPELADLYERLQLLDAKLTVAFQDVPVPEGLEQRLLDRLAAAVPDSEVSPRPKRFSRRLLWTAGGLIGTAAALLVAVWIGSRGPDDYSEQAVRDQAIEFFNNEWFSDEKPPEPGILLADQTRRPAYRISRSILKLPEIRWRQINGFMGRNGVAYDVSRGKATLYVVKRTVAGLPPRLPSLPRHSTAGCSMSAWMEKDLLYVLVVRGDARTYQGFVARRGPLT